MSSVVKKRIVVEGVGVLLLADILASEQLSTYSALLTTTEREYYETITAPHRRAEWLTSRVMLREELGGGVSTIYNGRVPSVLGAEVNISISHCDKYVALMLSSVPCGVDIEGAERDFSRVARRFLAEEERNWMLPTDIALAWAIKEAAYKMIGVLDIDFAKDFIIKKIDPKLGESILEYKGLKHHITLTTFKNYNIALCALYIKLCLV